MTTPETQPAEPKPELRPFQFSLRTLLLLFVVLGSSMAVFGAWGIVVFGLVVGLAVYIRHLESLSSLTFLVLVVLCLYCLIGLLLPGVQATHESGRRSQCRNNLCQIAAALNAYHQVHGSFPPAYIADKNGKPMHSWRVLILPYMEYDSLYRTYDLTEPWDGPKNKKLVAEQLREFVCPSDPNAYVSATSYLAVVGQYTAWSGEDSRKVGDVDFAKEAGNTIMVVEVMNSGISWAEPRDLALYSQGATIANLPGLLAAAHPGGQKKEFYFTYYYTSGVHVAMADGSVRVLKTDGLSNEDLLWNILQIGGCKESKVRSRVLFEDCERRLNWPNIAALTVWLLSVGTLLTHAVRSRKVVAFPPPPS